MILRYQYLSQHTKVFQAMTGLPVSLFDELEGELTEPFYEANRQRLARPNRQRAEGGGREPELECRDQLLMGVVWLRCYPKQVVMAYLFGVSETSVSRVLNRVLPLLEQSGRDTMRMPDPGRKRRRNLDELLHETPELVVLIDSFEQRVQRPRNRQDADAHYSGKKSNIRSKARWRWMKRPACSSMWPPVSPARPRTSSCWQAPVCSNGYRLAWGQPVTWLMSASRNSIPPGWRPPHGVSPEVKSAPPKTLLSTGPLPNGGFRWNIPSALLDVLKPLPKQIGTIDVTTPLALWLSVAWPIVA
jgi:hypothetical protein